MGAKNRKCPRCYKKSLIPSGAVVTLRIQIRKGGYNEARNGWTEGYATKAKSGAVYLNCNFTVVDGEYSGKRFSSLIGLRSPKGDWWGNEGRKTLRKILNSSHCLQDNDYSPSTRKLRRLESFASFVGLEFIGEVDTKKGHDGILRNELKAVITPEDERYKAEVEASDDGEGTAEGLPSHLSDPNYEPIWLSKV